MKLLAILLLTVVSATATDRCVRCPRDGHGRIQRSQSAKAQFKRLHPCPANGHRYGACPGYVIDHVIPLECGGADKPSNMQYQTIAEGKAKDRIESNCPLMRQMARERANRR